MRGTDKRDELMIVSAAGEPAIDPRLLAAVEARIAAAGGALEIWGVLREDIYETTFGDGFYLHLRGVALNEMDAKQLAACAGDEAMTRWHIRPYTLCLEHNAPSRSGVWSAEEEFSINDVVNILGEIAPGATASMLMIGSGERGRAPGPHMLSLR